MPPPDYAAYRKVVPNSGIAKTSVMAPANVAAAAELDPVVQQYLAEQRAVREPWSSYLPRVGTNLYNAGKSLLTEGIAPSAIVQGAVETAGKATDLMSGAIPAWDPYTSMPNPAAVEATTDIAGAMTLGAGAVPAEANALRAGVKGVRTANEPYDAILVVHGGSNFDEIDKAKLGSGEPGGIRPLGNGLYGYHVPMDDPEAAKNAIEGARTYARKYGRGEKTIQVFKVPKSVLLGSNGPIPLEGFPERQLGKPGQAPTREELAAFKAETQLNSERLPGGNIELSILDPSIATRVGKFKVDTPAEKIFGILEEGGPADSTTLNMGMSGFLDRGFQAVFAPEGRGGAAARQADKPATVIADVPRPKAPRDNIGFYSRAQEALLASDQTSGTVQQFVAYLKKSGVKQPEIDALLKNYGPDEKVTTKQLVNTLAAEEVMVRDEITDAFRDDYANMPGGTNYRMLNIAWSNPDANYGMVPYTYSPHNLPDNTLVHARLKDDVYTDPATGTAKKVLRVEELQSDWAQQGKGKWALPADPKRIKMENIPLEKFEDEYVKRRKKDIEQRGLDEADIRKLAQTYIGQARAANSDKITMYRVTGVPSDNWDVLSAVQDPFTPEELLQETRDTFGEELKTDGPAALAMTPVQEMLFNEQFGQAPAPYVTQGTSGVVPLATKRLLLEAAKNGQEEIVFAPGHVHARRWGTNDKKTADGLKAFYDDVLPKELQDVAKDVNKITGIKGLEVTREPRPFVPAESSRPKKWYDDNLYTWFDNIPDQQRTDLGFAPPAVGDLASTVAHADKMTALNNVNSRLSYKLGQGESIEAALGDLDTSLQQEKELRLRLASRHDNLIEALENMPYDQMTTKMQEALQSIYRQRQQYQKQAEQIQLQMDVLPKALGIYKAWAKETGGGGNGEALVVKLSPDLREYLKKNGLPRFAKGGIVDLALHGAWA